MNDKRNRHGTVDKLSSEQRFHKSTTITFIIEISGALHLAEPGLTAGWQTKYRLILKFKITVG